MSWSWDSSPVPPLLVHITDPHSMLLGGFFVAKPLVYSFIHSFIRSSDCPRACLFLVNRSCTTVRNIFRLSLAKPQTRSFAPEPNSPNDRQSQCTLGTLISCTDSDFAGQLVAKADCLSINRIIKILQQCLATRPTPIMSS